jgi:hypothetical protein
VRGAEPRPSYATSSARAARRTVTSPPYRSGATLPGCISEGDSADEALSNIREAIELYLEPVDDDLALVAGGEVRELVV